MSKFARYTIIFATAFFALYVSNYSFAYVKRPIPKPQEVTPPGFNYVQYVDILQCKGDYLYVENVNSSLDVIDTNPIEAIHIRKRISPPTFGTDLVISNGYAYLSSFDSLDIIDTEPLFLSQLVKSIPMPGERAYGVDVSDGYAFVVDRDEGLHIVDIDPLESAHIVNSLETPGKSYDVTVMGDYAFIADCDSGLQIVDINSPESPYVINSIDTPGSAIDVVVSDGYAFVADNNFTIIDVDPVETAHIVKIIETTGHDVRGLVLSEGYAFLVDCEHGVPIVDVNPPENAYIVATINAPGHYEKVAVSGDYAFIPNPDGGIRIFKLW